MNVLLILLFTLLETARPQALRVRKVRAWFLTGFIFVSFLWGWSPQLFFVAASTGEVTITGTVPGCGDGVIQTGESCDGSNFNNQVCSNLGFSGGILACNSDCTFNVSQCTSSPPPPGEGGGTFRDIPFFKPKPSPFIPFFKPKPSPLPVSYDFNGDGLRNFRDLSIMLFWFEKTGPEISRYDFNKDGKINFVDVSIFLYHWKDA